MFLHFLESVCSLRWIRCKIGQNLMPFGSFFMYNLYHILHAKLSFNGQTECHTGPLVHHLETERLLHEILLKKNGWQRDMCRKNVDFEPPTITKTGLRLLFIDAKTGSIQTYVIGIVHNQQYRIECTSHIIYAWTLLVLVFSSTKEKFTYDHNFDQSMDFFVHCMCKDCSQIYILVVQGGPVF